MLNLISLGKFTSDFYIFQLTSPSKEPDQMISVESNIQDITSVLNQKLKLMKGLILIFLLVLFAHPLTLPNNTPSIPEPLKAVDSTLDVKKTEANNTKNVLFMDQMKKIKTEAGVILESVEASFGTKYTQLINNLHKFMTGLDAIRKNLRNNNLQIFQNKKVCAELNNSQKQEINRQINATKQNLIIIGRVINEAIQLEKLTNLSAKISQLSDNYLNLLKQVQRGSFCTYPHTHKQRNVPAHKKQQTLYYKNNLEVSNWYFGSTNQIKYKASLIIKAANHNLTTCPNSLPFVRENEQKCFNCPPNTIYNLGTQKCQSCESGKMLNVAKGTCQPCYGQIFIVKHQFVCKACALQAEQLFDPKVGKCYKCKNTEYLDGTSRSCKPIKCPANQPRFNRQLLMCQQCAIDQIINPKDPSKCLPKCDSQKPLYNKANNTCSQCPKDSAYMVKTKKCQKIAKIGKGQLNEGQVTNQNGQQLKNGTKIKGSSNGHSLLSALLPSQTPEPDISPPSLAKTK